MHSTMMHMPMTVQMIMHHGARIHGRAQVMSYDGDGLRTVSFAETARRARHLAAALQRRGLRPGDRVATLCWNHQPHMDAYLAVPSLGAVLHTLNLRLFAEQLRFIIEHAGDRFLIVDHSLVPLIEPVLEQTATVEQIIVIDGDGSPVAGRASESYDSLIAEDPGDFTWPEITDDTQAAVACYTSGTTGNPKGVVYSHRTIFVHSLASMAADTFAISQTDRILLLPPMFHANAWGLPFTAFFAGADLVMPGAHLKPETIRHLITETRPSFTAMVPTLVNDLLRIHASDPIDMGCFRVLVAGGSAVAPALIDRVRAVWDLPILQGWGMTETSPICCLAQPPRGTPIAEEAQYRSLAGRPVPGMQVRLTDDADQPLPEDGKTVGNLHLRGPWVTGSYHDNPSPDSFTEDGWLRTGDVGTISPEGYVRITDRSKDVIKSGGEWVSSVELENSLMELEGVAEAAVIAVPDPRWEERPLAIIVPEPNSHPDPARLRAALEGRVARFWLPEYWSFTDALPRTSVGKIDKKVLRKHLDDGKMAIQEQR